jgi:alanine-glyoxylate transaminase/serine-glyoxylate transaminase/serine-pyruvate transaminase
LIFRSQGERAVATNAHRIAGRHFLQIPGPTPVPDRILRAMARPVIDHRGPEFQRLGRKVIEGLGPVFGASEPVYIFQASGTGAWEAALVNTLSPGDAVLMFETGHFASLWSRMAQRLGLAPQVIGSDWRAGADAKAIGERLVADTGHAIKAVCVVHNETSTGCVTDIAAVRRAIDAAGHPALLLVDTISSLASIDYRHDEWGVDVTIAGSQKGLMLPPGLSFNAISAKALAAAQASRFPKLYWSWAEMREPNARGFFPYTPATSLLYGLSEALDMLDEEGLSTVFVRHRRHAAAVRAAIGAWGLEVLCRVPEDFSASLTAVLVPEGVDAEAVRSAALERFDLSLGIGLGHLAGKVFRIGHLGDTNDLTILGALAGVEMALEIAKVTHAPAGVDAAMAVLGAAN